MSGKLLSPALTVYRVRWRYDHWSRYRALSVRLFSTGAFADGFARKLRRRGAEVEISKADRAIRWQVAP